MRYVLLNQIEAPIVWVPSMQHHQICVGWNVYMLIDLYRTIVVRQRQSEQIRRLRLALSSKVISRYQMEIGNLKNKVRRVVFARLLFLFGYI